uniref:Uncharacterized protein n=1 Tax=Kalanchoe fedtschenkoi TaxID=63787 RepID=A0A7N0TIK8_KALFE
MEPVVVPHNNLPPRNPRHQFNCSMAVSANPQIFRDPDRTSVVGAQQSKHHRQLFTVNGQMSLLVFLLHVMQG